MWEDNLVGFNHELLTCCILRCIDGLLVYIIGRYEHFDAFICVGDYSCLWFNRKSHLFDKLFKWIVGYLKGLQRVSINNTNVILRLVVKISVVFKGVFQWIHLISYWKEIFQKCRKKIWTAHLHVIHWCYAKFLKIYMKFLVHISIKLYRSTCHVTVTPFNWVLFY